MNEITSLRKPHLLGVGALLLGVLFVFLFYKQEIGLNYPLYMLSIVGLGLLFTRLYQRQLEYVQYAVIASALFFSAMVFVRSGDPLTFFNILGSLLLLLLVVETFTGSKLRSLVAGDYLGVVFLPLRFIVPFFETLPLVISFQKFSSRNPRTKEIIRGSFMAVVALFVFSWLFASADAGFEKIISRIFSFNFAFDIDLRNEIILTAFATAFFIGGFGFMFLKTHSAPAPAGSTPMRGLGLLETSILLVSVNMLFFGFILLQLSYLFGGAEYLFAQGLTYAEYARSGFTQLVWVAIFSFLIISFAEKQIVQEGGVHIRRFQVLAGALIFEVIAILVSAYHRLALYEDAYGFTVIRLYSHALQIWLAVLFLLLAHHIWKNGKRSEFSFRAFCSLIILLFSMNMLNPDAFIAKQNLERYHETGKLDAEYLGSLSNDALPYTKMLFTHPDEEVRNDFVKGRVWQENHRPSNWREMRLTSIVLQSS